MSSLKTAVGAVPSLLISRMIDQSTPSQRAGRLVDYINEHPNWFSKARERFLVRTRFDFSIWCNRHDVIGRAIIENGQWEGLLSQTISACLEPGGVAVDIGANMGYDTMLMSNAVGPKGCVIAFEPDLRNLASLLENLSLLPNKNVAVQSSGLGDASLLARISGADLGNLGTPNLRPGETSGAAQPILVSRFDEVVPREAFARINLVKIDVEGFEHKAILGMGQLLDRVDFLTCEVDRGYLAQCGTTPEAIFETLKSHGFSSYCAQPNSVGNWVPSGPDFAIDVKESHHFDALFCRRTTPALERFISRR